MTRPPYDVYALHILNEEVVDLIERNIQIKVRIGVGATPVEQFFLSGKDIDDIILEKINEINDIKREIIKISEDALNAIGGINAVGIVDPQQPDISPFSDPGYPGRIADPSAGIGSDWYLCEISTNPASYNKYNFIFNGTGKTANGGFRGAVGVGSTYIQCNGKTPDPYVPPEGSNPGTPVQCLPDDTTTIVTHNINVTTPITFAPVYPDHLRAWQFPELERGFGATERDPGQNNPAWPGEYQTINDQLANTGIGLTSNLFFNGEYNGVFSAVEMGVFYDITGLSQIPVYARTDGGNDDIATTFSSKISALETKIADIRIYITDVANGVNSIKLQKFERQLSKWGLEFSFDQNERRIAADRSAIKVIEAKTNPE